MLLLMWALLIRPQQRKEKELKAMLAQVEKGDGVVTTGGLHGRVTGIADDVLGWIAAHATRDASSAP